MCFLLTWVSIKDFYCHPVNKSWWNLRDSVGAKRVFLQPQLLRNVESIIQYCYIFFWQRFFLTSALWENEDWSFKCRNIILDGTQKIRRVQYVPPKKLYNYRFYKHFTTRNQIVCSREEMTVSTNVHHTIIIETIII